MLDIGLNCAVVIRHAHTNSVIASLGRPCVRPKTPRIGGDRGCEGCGLPLAVADLYVDGLDATELGPRSSADSDSAGFHGGALSWHVDT